MSATYRYPRETVFGIWPDSVSENAGSVEPAAVASERAADITNRPYTFGGGANAHSRTSSKLTRDLSSKSAATQLANRSSLLRVASHSPRRTAPRHVRP